MRSFLFRLDHNDFARGLVVAVLAALFTYFSSALQNQGLHFDLNEVLRIALIAGVSYLAKNFASDENGKVFGKI